jgi:hypothetical protein
MISIEGMNLDVDDWHGRMDLIPFEFGQLVANLFGQNGTGKQADEIVARSRHGDP